MNVLRICMVAGLVFFTSQSYASPNFSYVSLGYSNAKITKDDASCSQGGIAIQGSVPLNEWYYAVAEHMDQTSNNFCGITKTSLGAGIHHDVGSTSAAYAQGVLISADYPWEEHLGIGVSVGIRTLPINGTEIKGFFTYESIDGDDMPLFGIGTNMWMDKSFSGFLELAFGKHDEQRLHLGIRYNF